MPVLDLQTRLIEEHLLSLPCLDAWIGGLFLVQAVSPVVNFKARMGGAE